jgi:hypothetical protein
MRLALSFVLIASVGCAAVDTTDPGSEEEAGSVDLRPNGKGETKQWAKINAGGHSTGIQYHGGPLMLGTPTAYYIFYGNWSASSQQILSDFMTGLSGSPWFGINKTYYDGSNAHATGTVNFGGSTTDNYSQGTSIANVGTIVTDALAAGKLPIDANGVYFVISSADVKEGQFCSNYCGYHTYTTYNSTTIKYAFIGDGDRCPSACEAQTISPNGDTGADGAASIIAHELSETVTDPTIGGWYDRRGYENADKCAWTFGATQNASNGSKYNVALGSRKFLIQQNWVNLGAGYCGLQ